MVEDREAVRLTDSEALALPALIGGSLSALEMCQALAADTSKAVAMLGMLQVAQTRGLVRPNGGRWALTDLGRRALASGSADGGEHGT